MTVGERIKLKREELGLSQTELAQKMGYADKSTISKAETSGDDVTTSKVKKYANALGCSFDWLMGWQDIEWDAKTQDIIVNEPENTILEKYQETIGSENLSKYFDFLSAFTNLSEKDQQIVVNMVDSLSKK